MLDEIISAVCRDMESDLTQDQIWLLPPGLAVAAFSVTSAMNGL